MAKPLRLFIRPDDDWQLEHGYGPQVPPPPPPQPQVFHNEVLLRTTGAGNLFAAVDGQLSASPPLGILPNPTLPITIPAEDDSLPDSVNLYLHISPFVASRAAFRQRAAVIDNIFAFAYLNVETASLKGALAELLDRAALSPTADKPTPDQVIEMLVRGRLNVPVTAGHAIGAASAEGAPAGERQVGFTVLTFSGPLDPAHAYDVMRDFVEEGQSDIDRLLFLMPKNWPIFDQAIDTDTLITFTQTALFPMNVLENLRTSRNLIPAQWRQVGDNQKKLFRKRLLKRFGHAPAGSTDTPFEFDDLDWQNVFQLEAIVEFFANYDDPWATRPDGTPAVPQAPTPPLVGATAQRQAGDWIQLDGNPDLSNVVKHRHYIYLDASPRQPTPLFMITDVDVPGFRVRIHVNPNIPAGGSAWHIDLYQSVDFLDPAGVAATVAGTVVTLDGNPDLTRVEPNRDSIVLDNDMGVARRSRTYLITAVDDAAHTVTVDIAPTIIGPSSLWRINLRPTAIIIDPFGARLGLSGKHATVAAAAPNVVTLGEPIPNLSRINPNFDTIYFPSDTARDKRTYRITAGPAAPPAPQNQVSLDGNPDFGAAGASSAWHIQAGISGSLGADNLGPGEANGYDHYDAMLFVVKNGRVQDAYQWSSYSSRTNIGSADGTDSSIRGNRRYDIFSYRSNEAFRNYCFAVRDPGWGGGPDGVREARYYFDPPPDAGRDDTANPGANPAYPGAGKTEIRLHYGRDNNPEGGSGSGGCLVSPNFYSFRDSMIDLYQEDYQAIIGERNTTIDLLLGAETEEQNNHLLEEDNPTSDDWDDDTIKGTLWLIRPDERPL